VNGFGCSACDVGRLGQQTHHDVTVPHTSFPHEQYLRFSETLQGLVGVFILCA